MDDHAICAHEQPLVETCDWLQQKRSPLFAHIIERFSGAFPTVDDVVIRYVSPAEFEAATFRYNLRLSTPIRNWAPRIQVLVSSVAGDFQRMQT